MNRAILFCFAAAAALASLPASAAIDPTPGPKDPRIRSTPYDPRQILRVVSTGMNPVALVYEQGEEPNGIAGLLVHLSSSDDKEDPPKDWLAKVSGNVLVLQPLRDNMPVSMLFVKTQTSRGDQRNYVYELGMRPGNISDSSDRGAYVEVDYVYPHRPSPEEIAAARARREEAASMRVNARLTQTSLSPVKKNANYWKRDPKGCPVLAPLQVWDDGQQTTLVFAPNAVIPEIYPLGPDRKRSVVQAVTMSMPDGNYQMIPSVYEFVQLRRGELVCELWNRSYGARPATQPGNGSGTIDPSVIREIRTR